MTNPFLHLFPLHFVVGVPIEGKQTNWDKLCSMLLLRNTEEIPVQNIGSHLHLISISTAKEIDVSGFLADSLPFETPRNGSYYKIWHISFPLGQL